MKFEWTSGFMRRFSGNSDASRNPKIEVGDRFFQVGMGASVWTVDRLCAPEACDIPHVVITRSGPCPATKILSVTTLRDPNLYRRDRREPGGDNTTDNRRRHSDPPNLN